MKKHASPLAVSRQWVRTAAAALPSSVRRSPPVMRLCLMVLALLILPAPPAAADWERLRPRIEPPPVFRPQADAVCREKARSIDERIRRAEAAAAAAGGEGEIWITDDTRADLHRFMRRCFQPRICLAAKAPAPRLRDRTVTGPYERLLRLCGKQDGQP